MKILYIEDYELNFRLVDRYVSDLDAGIELLHAPDGLSGVDLALTHLPDLILLDINLPKLHGFKVFEEIRKNENAKNIPIVAVSADTTQKNIDMVMEIGFDKFLPKPLDFETLYDCIKGAAK